MCAAARNVLAASDCSAAHEGLREWLRHFPGSRRTAAAVDGFSALSALRVTNSYPNCAMVFPHADSISSTAASGNTDFHVPAAALPINGISERLFLVVIQTPPSFFSN